MRRHTGISRGRLGVQIRDDRNVAFSDGDAGIEAALSLAALKCGACRASGQVRR